MSPENLTLQAFASEFLAVARGKKTGTYQVLCPDGRQSDLLFHEGSIIDVDTRAELSLLTTAIINTGRVSDKDMKRAKRSQAKEGLSLGALLLQVVQIPEEELVSVVRSALAEAICAILTSVPRKAVFIEHGPDERLAGFTSDLSEVLEIQADPEELFLEAARRLTRWDLVEREFSILRDVYYATPAAFKYFQEEARYPHQVAMIGLIDGRNDFTEVISRIVERFPAELDPFRAFAIVRSLVARNEVQVLNPVQLYQLGLEYLAAGNHRKALKLFLRASERGLDDFDISWKIAQSLEGVGNRDEAAQRYQEFAEKCRGQLRPQDAVSCYRKAIELSPSNLAWQRRMLEILLQENHREDALALGLLVATRQAEAGNPRGGLHLLLDLRRLGFGDDRLGEKILELAHHCGDEATYQAEQKRLAGEFHAKKDIDRALQMYQQMYCSGKTTSEVRLKLVELHLQKGNTKQALEHIGGILSLGEGERIKDPSILKYLHETVIQLRPGEMRSHKWLVDHHLRMGNKEATAGILKNLIAYIEKEGDPREAVRALKQMISLEPAIAEHRLSLARIYEKLGRSAEQREELREAARLAARGKDAREAERVHLGIIKSFPYDVETRKTLAEMSVAQGETAQAAAYLKQASYLQSLAGATREARESCRRAFKLSPRDVEALARAAELSAMLDDNEEAAKELLLLARAHLEHRNLGQAREAAVALLRLRPGMAEGLDLMERIDTLEAALSARRSPPAAPAAPHAAAQAAPPAPAAVAAAPAPAVAQHAPSAPAAPIAAAPIPAAPAVAAPVVAAPVAAAPVAAAPVAAAPVAPAPVAAAPVAAAPMAAAPVAPAPVVVAPVAAAPAVAPAPAAAVPIAAAASAAAPAPPAAEAPPAVPPAQPAPGNDEPFRSGPAVVQTTVAGITARLKNLKSRESAPAGAPEGAAPAAAAPAAPAASGAALSSAASRLRALAGAGRGAPAAAAPAAAASTPAGATPAGAAPAEPAPAAPEPGSSTPVAAGPEELERLRAALQPNAAPATVPPTGKSLGKSAAALAKLRKAMPPAGSAAEGTESQRVALENEKSA